MPAPGALIEPAPAKLNLYLHVVGRRADGYHGLDSLVAFVEAGDVLRAETADELSLTIDGPFAAGLSAGDDNLVMKAARALMQLSPTSPQPSPPPGAERERAQRAGEVGAVRGARLTLTKNLPVASGIGGGSADAAATLRLLRRLWQIEIGDAGLHRIAGTLGADVPVCLLSRPTFLRGIGDVLRDAPPLPEAGLVLVNPRIPLSTPDVFRRREGAFTEPAAFPGPFTDAASLAIALGACRNDLETPAGELCPVIPTILAALRASPGCRLARLSGSGATGFGLYDDAGAAAAAASWVAAREPGWWVQPTRWAAH